MERRDARCDRFVTRELSRPSQTFLSARRYVSLRSAGPYAASGVYVNFLGNEGEERVRAAYGVNYDRLVALKNRYDPTNFFSRNQNIRPTVSQPRPLTQAVGDLAA